VKLVWKEDHQMWSLMAMKVVNKWSLVDSSGACIERDFLLRHCHSPEVSENYIIRFRASHQTVSHLYFFFDYCRGGDLLAYMQTHDRLDPACVSECARQLTVALNYVHGCGYAHGDVRLENILISAEGDLRLADFGGCSEGRDCSEDWRSLAGVVYELSTGRRVAGVNQWPAELRSAEWAAILFLYDTLMQTSSPLYSPIPSKSSMHAVSELSFDNSYNGQSEESSSSDESEVDPLMLRCFSYESV